MNRSDTAGSMASAFKNYGWVLAGFWTALVIVSVLWNVFQVKKETVEAACIQARSSFGKDIIYRRWNSMLGGVYVPASERTPPNPYLTNVPERDIQTPSGRQMTLMNPAYMTRLAFELGQKEFGVRGHITSLKPVRPENAPDSWEIIALQAFDFGENEIYSVETLDGQNYLRLMRPLITEKSCLLCHAQQGYKENDIRGGISVAIPMQPLLSIQYAAIIRLVSINALFWLLGIVGITFGTVRQIRNDLKRCQDEEALRQARDSLEMRVKERTAEIAKINEALRVKITERKQAEKALQESENRLNIIYESAPDAYYINDYEGVFINANMAAEELLGYSREELIEKNFVDAGILSLDEVEKALNVLAENIKGKSTGPDEFTLKRKDGTKVSVEILTHPVKIGGEGRVLGIARDITKRIQAQEERKKLQEQLLQFRKMEAIGSLAGGIAHEFNNILTTIIGNTQLAIGDIPERNPARECLEEIQSASLRAKDVVRQLLGFARKSVFQLQPVHLSPVIKEAMLLIRASTPASIEICQNLSFESDTVMADSSKINLALLNLCTNARNAMQEKGGELELKLENTTLDDKTAAGYEDLGPGNYVKMTVRDTGHGIDPKIIDRIFEPYFTTRSLAEATGMGLAVVHGIVKRHNGAIIVESEPGKGTVFEVLFPLTEKKK